uniref:Sm protein B n=1 Tax=Trypanosoma congolense (strain IL3000) TaxID=1068625 RepID=G0UJG0_TRYCI|nr:putative small nuclear ribonucleoprotein SmD1 [Trypanosoma congolense IL3000]
MGHENMRHNINRTLRVTLVDGREMTGKMLVYDRCMNVVLADAVESRKETKKMKDAGISPQRKLGLVLLRGEHVVAVSVVKDNTTDEGSRPANFESAPREKAAGVKHGYQ